MNRIVIRADGKNEVVNVGKGWQDWNRAINANLGCIVMLPDGSQLWCDDEALCKGEPVRNSTASFMTGQDIYGDAILFNRGDIQ